MRILLLAALLVAGCATPEPPVVATPTTESDALHPPSPTRTTAMPTADPSPAPAALGVVLDERHEFAMGGQVVHTFEVGAGVSKVVLEVESSGPSASGRASSAVVDFYYPRTTSPFLTELPAQNKRNFTVEDQPHPGTWRVVFDGQGDTVVHVRVTLS